MSERVSTTITVDRGTLAEVKRIAYLRGVSVSEFVSQELNRVVEEEKEKEGRQHG